MQQHLPAPDKYPGGWLRITRALGWIWTPRRPLAELQIMNIGVKLIVEENQLLRMTPGGRCLYVFEGATNEVHSRLHGRSEAAPPTSHLVAPGIRT